MLSNMAASLILHKRINTTLAKAKALRTYVEPLITRAKTDSTHNRRIVFGYLQHKEPIKELFSIVAEKVADRPGGYTRIIRTGTRLGDNAETCLIELVDFNEIYVKEEKVKKTRRKRTRRSAGDKASSETIPKPVKDSPEKSKEIISEEKGSEKDKSIKTTPDIQEKEAPLTEEKDMDKTAEKSPELDIAPEENEAKNEAKNKETDMNPEETKDDQTSPEKQ
jgi:large subunit ribosomal protein L17